MSVARRDPRAIRVRETRDAFVVSMTLLNGSSPDGIDVSVFGNTLTLTGEFREEQEEQGAGGRWILRDHRFGAFERVLTLATAVDSGATTTGFEDGVLTIRLPKVDRSEVARSPRQK